MRALVLVALFAGCDRVAEIGSDQPGAVDLAGPLDLATAVDLNADLTPPPDLPAPFPFGAPVGGFALHTPTLVTAGDINLDTVCDMVIADGDAIWLVFSNGPKNWNAWKVPVGDQPRAPLPLYDYDGDGYLDLFVLMKNTPGFHRWNGAKETVTDSGTVTTSLTALAFGDLDGKPPGDMVTVEAGLLHGWVDLGAQDQYHLRGDQAIGPSPRAVAIADLDGDGRGDAVVADGQASTVAVLHGNGDGTFVPLGQPVVVGDAPFDLAIADVDGDARADVVTLGASAVRLLRGDGKGGFAPPQSTALPADATGMAVADFDRDGHADVALACPTLNTLEVLLGGAGGFAAPVGVKAGQGPNGVAACDLDGDQRTDLVVIHASTGFVDYFYNGQ